MLDTWADWICTESEFSNMTRLLSSKLLVKLFDSPMDGQKKEGKKKDESPSTKTLLLTPCYQ